MHGLIILIFMFNFTSWCDSLSINGTITYDTHFFYRKFPTPPSKLASFEYTVTFPFQLKYVNLFFYTTKIHVNIEEQCSVRSYDQVMHNSSHQEFRTSHKACPDSYSKVHCKQSRSIQDYIPRHFAFSFGFYCQDKSKKSLKGLKYNVIIYSQSNTTTCSTMPNNLTYCSNYYRQVSFPNLIDHQNMEDAAKLFHKLFPIKFILDHAYDCYPYFLKTMCYVFFPRFNATSNSFIVPCMEAWKELSEACFGGPQSASMLGNLLPSHLSTNKHKPIKSIIYNLPSYFFSNTTFDYKYLPPSSSNLCYYERVICKYPTDVTGAKIERLHDNGTYFGGDPVTYSCIDDSKEMYGNSTVRCLYSGKWSDPPVCRNRDTNTNLLKIVLPTFILLV